MCGVILTRLWPLNPNLDLRTSVDEKQLVKLMVTTDPSVRLRPPYAASEFHAERSCESPLSAAIYLNSALLDLQPDIHDLLGDP